MECPSSLLAELWSWCLTTFLNPTLQLENNQDAPAPTSIRLIFGLDFGTTTIRIFHLDKGSKSPFPFSNKSQQRCRCGSEGLLRGTPVLRSPLSPGTIKFAVQGQDFVSKAGRDESAETLPGSASWPWRTAREVLRIMSSSKPGIVYVWFIRQSKCSSTAKEHIFFGRDLLITRGRIGLLCGRRPLAALRTGGVYLNPSQITALGVLVLLVTGTFCPPVSLWI